jgi:hypothetical protein
VRWQPRKRNPKRRARCGLRVRRPSHSSTPVRRPRCRTVGVPAYTQDNECGAHIDRCCPDRYSCSAPSPAGRVALALRGSALRIGRRLARCPRPTAVRVAGPRQCRIDLVGAEIRGGLVDVRARHTGDRGSAGRTPRRFSADRGRARGADEPCGGLPHALIRFRLPSDPFERTRATWRAGSAATV